MASPFFLRHWSAHSTRGQAILPEVSPFHQRSAHSTRGQAILPEAAVGPSRWRWWSVHSTGDNGQHTTGVDSVQPILRETMVSILPEETMFSPFYRRQWAAYYRRRQCSANSTGYNGQHTIGGDSVQPILPETMVSILPEETVFSPFYRRQWSAYCRSRQCSANSTGDNGQHTTGGDSVQPILPETMVSILPEETMFGSFYRRQWSTYYRRRQCSAHSTGDNGQHTTGEDCVQLILPGYNGQPTTGEDCVQLILPDTMVNILPEETVFSPFYRRQWSAFYRRRHWSAHSTGCNGQHTTGEDSVQLILPDTMVSIPPDKTVFSSFCRREAKNTVAKMSIRWLSAG